MTTRLSIIDAIPTAHRHRFACASMIRASEGLHPALALQNHDVEFEKGVQQEIIKRVSLLGHCINLPCGISDLGEIGKGNYNALAENFFTFQRNVIEMRNRLSEKEFFPTPVSTMISFCDGLLKPNDPRKGTLHLFNDPTDFVNSYRIGLEMWKHNERENGFGSVGILDVSGGAGTRAGKELENYPTYASKFKVTSETPRSLYPIPATGKTFKGILVNVIRKITDHLQVRTPHFIMNSYTSAPFMSDYIKTDPEAREWDGDIISWNQRVLHRYNISDEAHPLPGFYPAGHGDNATLSYQYGILHAMKEIGIKTVASSNGDEFLWYYMFPALLAKFGSSEAAMFAVAIWNANNQSGGFYGNGGLVETSRIPFSYVRKGVNPEVLNSTFYAMDLESLIKGAEYRSRDISTINIISKSTKVTDGEEEKLVNALGFDSWMGDEFSSMVLANTQKVDIYEGPRNIFLGMKGPQQVANNDPQDFLLHYGEKISYNRFYTMMAHKVYAALDVMLAGDAGAKQRFAEQLFKNNFDLINIHFG